MVEIPPPPATAHLQSNTANERRGRPTRAHWMNAGEPAARSGNESMRWRHTAGGRTDVGARLSAGPRDRKYTVKPRSFAYSRLRSAFQTSLDTLSSRPLSHLDSLSHPKHSLISTLASRHSLISTLCSALHPVPALPTLPQCEHTYTHGAASVALLAVRRHLRVSLFSSRKAT